MSQREVDLSQGRDALPTYSERILSIPSSDLQIVGSLSACPKDVDTIALTRLWVVGDWELIDLSRRRTV